jgi:hypothetical protein
LLVGVVRSAPPLGSWSELTIGEIVFAWKYHVPTFLTFLFGPEDLFIERSVLRRDPELRGQAAEPRVDDEDRPPRGPGGFTTEATSAIKRSSRDPYTIVLVDRADLDELAHGAETVLEWLERLLCRPI